MRYLAVICMMLASISAAVAQMTHEETMVRTAYARLSYAAQLRVVAEDAMGTTHAAHNKSELKAQIANLAPQFQIDNVVVGNLSTFAGISWEQLVTKPNGDLIDVISSGVSPTFTTRNGTTKKSMFYVMTGWSSHSFERSWDGVSAAQGIVEVPKLPSELCCGSYASYRVRVTLEGRSRTYNALFLFGKDSKGNETIHMVDHVIGLGSLELVLTQSLYPEPLLETYYREIPEISDWIAANTISRTNEVRDAYCSQAGCGLPSNWVKKSLAVPIDPETRELLKFEPVL